MAAALLLFILAPFPARGATIESDAVFHRPVRTNVATIFDRARNRDRLRWLRGDDPGIRSPGTRFRVRSRLATGADERRRPARRLAGAGHL
jgi:hypothetical protein